ncbi:MAG: hypothetical protein AAFX09_08620 [Pseudomonadota bacterium]
MSLTHYSFRALGVIASAALIITACGPEDDNQSNDSGTSDGANASSLSEPAPRSEPSAPSSVTNAGEAQLEAARRRDATPVDAETGQRPDAEIEQITWEYGPCRDAASLIPPPLEGWGLLNDTPLGEWPIDADNARITYTYVDETLEPGTAEYAASRENMSIYISSGTAVTEALQTSLLEPVLREISFAPGPYNYPVGRFGQSALLGPYYVQMDGTGEGLNEVFDTIVRCAIEGGLIADGVDPATLTISPL